MASESQDLTTLRKILLGDELSSIRGSLSDTESNVASKVSGLKDEIGKALGQVRSELVKQGKTLGHTVYEEEKKRVEAFQELEGKMESLSDEIEKTVASRLGETERKLEGLEERISQLNDALDEQKEQGAKLAGVLQNFAQLVSGSGGSSQAQSAAPTQQKKPAAQQAQQAQKKAPQAQPVPQQRQQQKPPSPPPPESDDSPFSSSQKDLPESDEFLKNIDDIFKLGS